MAVGPTTQPPFHLQVVTQGPAAEAMKDDDCSTEGEEAVSHKESCATLSGRPSNATATRLTLRKLAGSLHAQNVKKMFIEFTTPPPSPDACEAEAQAVDRSTLPQMLLHGLHGGNGHQREEKTVNGEEKLRQPSFPAIAVAAFRAASESLQAGFATDERSKPQTEFEMQRADEEREEDIVQRVKDSCQAEMEAYIERVGGREKASLVRYWDDCVNGGNDRAGRDNPFESQSTSALQLRWANAFRGAWQDAGGLLLDEDAQEYQFVAENACTDSLDSSSDAVSDLDSEPAQSMSRESSLGAAGTTWTVKVRAWAAKLHADTRLTARLDENSQNAADAEGKAVTVEDDAADECTFDEEKDVNAVWV